MLIVAVFLLALVVVMLVVPWILARQPPDSSNSTTSSVAAGALPGVPFSSDRERRLWLWTAAVLVAIWSTLGPVEDVTAWLRARNLLRLSSAALLLVIAGILTRRWARQRRGGARSRSRLAWRRST